jgi:sugar fermentation stimulation protein A
MKGIEYFSPNYDTHPQFGEALKEAEKAGVKILAYDCIVTEDEIYCDREVTVRLDG